MLKITRQKIQATILLLFSTLIFYYLLHHFNWFLVLYDAGYYLPTATSYSLALLKISRFIDKHSMTIFVVFVLLVIFLVLLIWRWNLLEKYGKHITLILNITYILFFLVTTILFINDFAREQHFKLSTINLSTAINYLFGGIGSNLIVLLILVETIWKFRKKTTLRKYLNSVFFIFISSYFISVPVVDVDIWGVGIDLFVALFFYLISLIIATVEFIKKITNKPESNSVLSEQAIEQ